MAARYYDDALIQKLQSWVPENSNLRVLKPEETRRLFQTIAADNNDRPINLPFIALSRSTDITLLSNIKQTKSFNGLKLIGTPSNTAVLNVIPIKLNYQIDIYTKYFEEGDEYIRSFLFKLINNPAIKIEIPYNNEKLQAIDSEAHIEHIANIRVLDSISDTTNISEHLYAGQFTRWSIRLEIQDAFLFSIPYRKNWRINGVYLETATDLAGTNAEIEEVYKLN